MKIVFQHDDILPVKHYGGIERMLYWHMLELIKQGHQVVLIGHPESQVQEKGIELIVPTSSKWYDHVPSDADIIQLFYNYEVPIDIPTINTIGGNGKVGEKFTRNTVFVSRNHANRHGSESFVYNALDLSEYEYRPSSSNNWDNFLFLAKASWSVKNLKHCLRVCKTQKKHLHIAGGRAYLPSRYIHNYGMVGGEKKLEIIRNTDALLFPVRWHEPFGLAVIEAMTQGKPVMASPFGSLPELITEETGIICQNYEELEECVRNKPRSYDQDVIRKYVEDNFSISKFTSSYINLMKKILSGESLNQIEPELQSDTRAEDLLPF